MQSHAPKNNEHVKTVSPQRQVESANQALQFKNNRSETQRIDKIQEMANSSPQVAQLQSQQQKANNTGLPDRLKSGIESISGYSMDDVKVHYNSKKPAQLQAHAYAQGNQIHLGPGQEKHLPHEAWHVVQQKQGRVAPTHQLKSKIYINDDMGLEKEADIMGQKALQLKPTSKHKTKDVGSEATTLLHATPSTGQTIAQLVDNRSQFNAQQLPRQNRVVKRVNYLITKLGDTENTKNLWLLRELMDVLLSTFTDGLLARGVQKAEEGRVVQIKHSISETRHWVEYFYQQELRAGDDRERIRSIASSAAEVIPKAWGPAQAHLTFMEQVKATTSKTGLREAHDLGRGQTDSSIDIRSIELAKTIRKYGFVPDLIVGLSTAGAHIAARMAGYFGAPSEPIAKVVALRPKFVKPTEGEMDGKSQEELNEQNAKILSQELDLTLLVKRFSLAMKPKIKVLIVDDFTSSGGSLKTASLLIKQVLDSIHFDPEIKTAVSRYKTAQTRETLATDQGPVTNPIDYMVGQSHSGPRTEIHDTLDSMSKKNYRDYNLVANELDKGLTESGEDAITLVSL